MPETKKINTRANHADSISVNRILLFTLCFLLVIPAGALSQDLPKGFSGIVLGDELETIKTGLKGNPYFNFRGDRDVSFLPKKPESVIDCEGYYHIKRGLFQFSGNRLYIITLYLNPTRIDYYSMFTTLSEKYGPPRDLDPSGAWWENETVRVALEKPLTVKYIDREVFAGLKAAGETAKSAEEMSREMFLELF